MKIRHAEAEDIKQIQEVAMVSWQDAYSGIIHEETITEIVESWFDRDDLKQQVKDPIFYVAEEDGEIAGFVHASVKKEKAHLHRLYLRPEDQRKGVGTRLYEIAEQDARDSDAEVIRLEVMSENEKGLGFYLGKGFEEEKEEAVELNEKEVMQKVLVKTF
jgi:ribosomal protein S18 acetylase RimI-like enzyme